MATKSTCASQASVSLVLGTLCKSPKIPLTFISARSSSTIHFVENCQTKGGINRCQTNEGIHRCYTLRNINIDSSEKSNFPNREASQARNMYFSCRAPVYRIKTSDNVLYCVNPRQLHGKNSTNCVWNTPSF